VPKLAAEQLLAHCRETLAPAYLVSGDEPLLVQEASDQLRQAAREKGFVERELYHVDASLDIYAILQSANSLSLFASRKLIEIRFSSAKWPEKARDALIQYLANPSPDTLLLLVTPRWEKASLTTKWFKTLESQLQHIVIWPLPAHQFTRWVAHRLQQARLQVAPDAVALLASRVEGNLLACVQEIHKLTLLYGQEPIDLSAMAQSVADSARFDVFTLLDKATGGEARDAVRQLRGLRQEGVEAPVVLWALARELRLLLALHKAAQDGGNLEFLAKQQGVFEKRLPCVRSALRRLSAADLRRLLRLAAKADAAIKGSAALDAWALLMDIVLGLAGVKSLSPRSFHQLLAPSLI
jgi:DNA polymerase III subunit delta